MHDSEFTIIFRRPKYPVFVVSDDRLFPAFSTKQLAIACLTSTPTAGKSYIQVIDSTGEEFWYSPEQCALSPGFSFKRWTKKRIIEAFNSSSNAMELMQEYSMKSLSSKKLDRIIRDVCELLRS
jgi:hypothetical protein